jgi:alcohol dehydrogenase (cytochrome c)
MMMEMHRIYATLAASACVLALSAAIGSAQQPSPPLPTPDTPRPVPPILQSYKPVTPARLKHPEDGDWLLYRRTYDGWGYSPLSQITPDNAARLKPVWTLQTGQIEGHQAPPIVNNGVMFVATPGNQVLAIDAKKGDLLWRFKRPIPEDILLLHPTSRGVGLLGDKVYFAAADAVLVALDAKTGKEVWNAKVEDYTHGYYMSLAPLVADGKVMVGVSGGELGVRGFVAAFDAETGKEVWKTYTVPAPGEPGSETWPKGDQWKTGGGSVWITGIRSRNQPRLLGHGQWRAVDGRPASRRQSLHVLDGRPRCLDREDQGLPPVPPERFMGLGRGQPAGPCRLPARRQDREGSRIRRP